MAGGRFFFATATAAVAAATTHNLPLTMLAVGMTALCLISLLHALVVRRAVRSYAPQLHWSQAEIFEGEGALLSVAVGTIPPILAGRCTVAVRAVWTVRSIAGDWPIHRDAARSRFETRPALRGLYHPSTCAIRATDVFELFSISRPLPAPGALAVLPRSVQVPVPPIRAAGAGATDYAPLVRDRNDTLIEQRPYVAGDNVRRMAWNAVAHTGELFVRVGEEVHPPARAVHVTIDATAPGEGGAGARRLEVLDDLCRSAAGTVEALVGAGYTVTCSTTGGQPIPGSGGRRTARALAELTWEAPGGSAPDVPGVRIAVGRDGRSVITGDA